MITEITSCDDYDLSYNSIAYAHSSTSKVSIMPLIGDVNRQCLKFDDQNEKSITYSHHKPPHQSAFMPAAVAKRFMSFSLNGRYLALSWQPLNVDAELDPSKAFVLVYKVEEYKPNSLARCFEGDTPNCTIRFQGGCSFLPDGRLALLNETHLRIIELVDHTNGELEAEECYTVDLLQDLDDDGVSRNDFYDDLPGIREDTVEEILSDKKKVNPNKTKKSVTFEDIRKSDTDTVNNEEDVSNSDGQGFTNTCKTNEIFYEATEIQDQQPEQLNSTCASTLDEEEVEIINETELNSDDDFVLMKNDSLEQEVHEDAPSTSTKESEPEVSSSVAIENVKEENTLTSLELPPLASPPNTNISTKYDDASNSKRIKFIGNHAKTLKQSGAIFITSDFRHNIWKVERNSIKLYFSLPRNRKAVCQTNDYVFAISEFNNMVIATSQYSTFSSLKKPNSTIPHQLVGTLDVYDTCSETVIARLTLPRNRKPVNAISQVSFIQKEMYVLAVTYHYEASNHPSDNCYYFDLWDVGSGTHLAGKPFTSEVGYLPDSQFFINESIKLNNGCGAFIRAFPSIPPSINNGCIDKSDVLNSNKSSITAHLIPLLEDPRIKEEIHDGNLHEEFFISNATSTPTSSSAEKSSTKDRNESSSIFHIWSRAKHPSSSYSKRMPALSLPIYFLDNDMTYIMIVYKSNFNSCISIWKLNSFITNNKSGPLMTVYEKQVLYSFGNTNANCIERCLGFPSVMFDPSRILFSTSHSLNGIISHRHSFVVPNNLHHNNANSTHILVITVLQKDTRDYRTHNKDTYNSTPYQIEFDYSLNDSSPQYYKNNRECSIAIPLLKTSMLECALHAIVNENEQVNDISKLFYSYVFIMELVGSNLFTKSNILQMFASQIPELFTTTAGTQLLTRLARSDKHNIYLEFILNYLAEANIYNCHLHTVVSLKKGYTRTHALREAFVSQSWENVKSITKYITGDNIMNGTNYYLLEKYKSLIDQVVEKTT